MTILEIKKLGAYVLSAAFLACLSYSVLTLAAKPTYADTVCEAEDCAILEELGPSECSTHGGFNHLVCPRPGNPDWADIYCNNGSDIQINCSQF